MTDDVRVQKTGAGSGYPVLGRDDIFSTEEH